MEDGSRACPVADPGIEFGRGTWRARGTRAYNGGLGAEPPAGSRGRAPGRGVRGAKPPWSWKPLSFRASSGSGKNALFSLLCNHNKLGYLRSEPKPNVPLGWGAWPRKQKAFLIWELGNLGLWSMCPCPLPWIRHWFRGRAHRGLGTKSSRSWELYYKFTANFQGFFLQ